MAIIVAVISAGIALAALVVSIRVAKRQTAIQERMAAIEEARRAEEVEARSRAQVTARIVPGGPRTRLILHNKGPALARGVELEAASLDENPVPPIFGAEDLPVDLHAEEEKVFQVPIAGGDAAVLRVTVRWTDEAGSQEVSFTLRTM